MTLAPWTSAVGSSEPSAALSVAQNVDYVAGVSNAETTAERTFLTAQGCAIWESSMRGLWEFPPARLIGQTIEVSKA